MLIPPVSAGTSGVYALHKCMRSQGQSEWKDHVLINLPLEGETQETLLSLD